MHPSASDVETYVARYVHLTPGHRAERMARCPNHEDTTASLSINLEKAVAHCHSCGLEGTITTIAREAGWDDPPWANDHHRSDVLPDIWRDHPIHRWYDYGPYQVARVEYELNGKRKKEFPVWCDGWGLRGKGVARRLYNRDALAGATDVFICEGERDCETLKAHGLTAVCNLGGAGKWKSKDAEGLTAQHHVVILPDNDSAGRRHAETVAQSLVGRVMSIKIVTLPDLPAKGDVTDFFSARPDQDAAVEELLRIIDGADVYHLDFDVDDHVDHDVDRGSHSGVTLDDFQAYMPNHAYIFTPSRELWPGSSVDARIPPVPVVDEDGTPVLDKRGTPRCLTASDWLDQHRPVEQMTWIPGRPMLIRDRLVSEGGWIDRPGCTTFNLYRPPRVGHGDPDQASRWLDHLREVYPDNADHIVRWLAHRVQRPDEKINHALVLGGLQGIGKDSLLEPVKAAVGPWNFIEMSPAHLLGRFNGFVKSVILRISEARDLGDVNRFSFYDHLKTYTAAPPDVLRVDEKNLREISVWNVLGVVITTNHRTDGLYLPADDRRHFVAWSERTKDAFTEDYWNGLWDWYEHGGTQHVAAFLAAYNLATFNPKAPPPQTSAFFDIVDANRAPEDAELADALDRLGTPTAVTLDEIAGPGLSEFGAWLKDRKNARQIPHRLNAVGYVVARNPRAKDGLWRVDGRRQRVYARHDLSLRDRLTAAQDVGGDQ